MTILEDLIISARDGFDLSATRFGEGDRIVLINSATAVPRRFYRHFAGFLADHGFEVYTYDYRGIGDSRPAKLRGFEALARDWVLRDMTGVVEWLHETRAPSELHLVGHSIGGQLAGLLDRPERIDSMVTFSAQSGYWKLQGAEQKAVVAVHAHLTLPALSAIYGYMPWSLIGGEDLPSGVAREWASWCRNPRYLLGDDTLPLERYANFEAPILGYSFDDDNWGTPEAVDAMMNAYPNVERRHIVPREHGLERIEHFGFFKASSRALWNDVVEWMERLSLAPEKGSSSRASEE